jgi:HEAT repeat protein
MPKIRRSTICLACLAAFALLAAASAQAADSQAAAQEKERSLIALLRSDSPAAEKAIACKRLAVYGTQEAVPELAPLLADERLASWARIALEVIPGPEADEALRKAATTLKGKLLIGAINSIGVRRDAGAVDLLAGRLPDHDTDVAAAAAVALGHIGNAAATETLRKSLAGAPAAVRTAIAEGGILCAERLLAEGHPTEAVAIYDEIRRADVAKPRILEATRGAILARKSAGVPLLLEQLRSPDKGLFQIGLSTARELPGREVADALADELLRATPDRAALLLDALADRSDAAVSPAVLQAVKQGPKQVRIAAIGIVRRAGDASCVSTLLEIAIDPDAELGQAAKGALAGLPGEKVDTEIAARLPTAEGKTLALLIELVGQRRIDATTALLKAADNQDATIRSAALTALGETVGLKGIPMLVAQVIADENSPDAKVARQALRAACIRMPQREQCAEELALAMPRTSVSTKCVLLEILGEMEGAKALETIAAAAKSADPQLQDTASRLLGEWMNVDAAPVLLDLAKTAPGDKYPVRAMRGYIRIARQLSMPDQQRAEMCQNALEAARRTAEQKLVLEVVERHPNMNMLKLAVKAAQIPGLKEEATRVALVIAQKLGGSGTDARELLAKIGLDPVKVEIIKAEYGAGTRQHDATEVLRQQVGDWPLISLPTPNYNSNFGGDPAPGTVKQLKVRYRINGKSGEATFPENAAIVLPLPK